MIFPQLFKRCPKTGKIRGINRNAWPQWTLMLAGSVACLWYLVRVIPKPSRAAYPCQRAAAPMRIGFLAYVVALTGYAFSFAKAKSLLRTKRHFLAGLFFVVSILSLFAFVGSDTRISFAASGTPKGIYPGRVAWVYNSNAALWTGSGNYWAASVNPQAEYNKTFTAGINALSGGTSDASSWNLIFNWFNNNHGRSGTGYQAGDKIAIKINQNNSAASAADHGNAMNANPQTCLAVVTSLVNAGVPQGDIWIGDPSRAVTDNIFNPIHNAYPQVNVVDYFGNNGRYNGSAYTSGVFPNSDVKNAQSTCFYNARYLISQPLMKGHTGQVITFGAKNFYGTNGILPDWASNGSHPGDNALTAYMTNANFGGKVVLWCMDAMYPSPGLDGAPYNGVSLTPFSGKQMSSFIMSLDGVAEECVSYDFWSTISGQSGGTNYINNAAAAGVGVADHWNNSTAKQYAKNLNPASTGIELVSVTLGGQQSVPGTLALSAATYSVAENGGSLTVTVTRTSGTTGAVSVNYATSDGTAKAGAKYTAVSGTLTFANGSSTSQTFSVPIIDNTVVDGNMTFNITLSGITGGATLGSPATATTTIIDNEVPRTTLPATIQAEDYKTGGEGVAYHDVDAGNTGGVYRTDDVDIQACTDVGGGYNVGWINAGEWLAYNVSLASAGTFTYTARVASGNTGTKTLKIQIDGSDVSGGSVSFTTAAGWQSWTDAPSGTFSLPAGNHELRIFMVTGGFNLNYVTFTSATSANNPPSISISSPANNAHYATVPSSVVVSATASDADGSVAKVDFYNGATLAGTVTAAPYTWTFTSLGAGSYTLKAVATDNKGATGSASVNVSVGATSPGSITLNPSKDALVRGGANGATNYGTLAYLEAKTEAAGVPDYWRNIIMGFDISGFSGVVDTATLQLYRTAGQPNIGITVYQCSNTSWTETGITWNTMPALGASVTTVNLTAVNGWYSFNVTPYVAAQKAAGATSITFVLVDAEQGATAQQSFSSKEGANKPALGIAYHSAMGKKSVLPVAFAKINWGLGIRDFSNGAIRFTLPTECGYALSVVNMRGVRAAEVAHGSGAIGTNTVAVFLPQGVYLVRLTVQNGAYVDKMLRVTK